VIAPAVKMAKPVEDLRAFGKKVLLQPGNSQAIKFVITVADLAYFDTLAIRGLPKLVNTHLSWRPRQKV
jgi:hypothetical protein